MTILEAIEALEYRKHILKLTTPYLWTESEEIALTALKLISSNNMTYVDEIRELLRCEYADE